MARPGCAGAGFREGARTCAPVRTTRSCRSSVSYFVFVSFVYVCVFSTGRRYRVTYLDCDARTFSYSLNGSAAAVAFVGLPADRVVCPAVCICRGECVRMLDYYLVSRVGFVVRTRVMCQAGRARAAARAAIKIKIQNILEATSWRGCASARRSGSSCTCARCLDITGRPRAANERTCYFAFCGPPERRVLLVLMLGVSTPARVAVVDAHTQVELN